MTRPKIIIEKTQLDHILEALALASLLFLIVYPFIHFGKLPDQIPTHFDISGKPDDFKSKNLIWILPVIGIFIYFGFSFLQKIPHKFNYGVKITEENAEKQYRIALRLINVLKTIILASFAYIVWMSIQIVLKNAHGLGSGFTPILLVLVFGVIGYGLSQSIKNK